MNDNLNIEVGTTICTHGNQWCNGTGGHRPCELCVRDMRNEIKRLQKIIGKKNNEESH